MTTIAPPRRSRRLIGALAAVLIAAAAGTTITLGGQTALAAFPGQPWETQFEIDGNTAVGGGQDWASVPASAPNLQDFPGETQDGCTGVGVDADRIVPGTKIDDLGFDNPPTNGGSPNNKSDLCSVWTSWELVFVPTADLNDDPDAGQYNFIFYGAWSRPLVNGEIDVLFPLLGNAPGSNTDDLVISYDFNDNSGLTSIDVLRWNGSSWASSGPLAAGSFEATTSRGVEASGSTDLTFGEFAINLTVADILPENGPCVTFTAGDPITRTGNSSSASLEDIVDTTPITLTNCSSLTINKIARPQPLVPTNFPVTTSELDGAVIQFQDVTSLPDTLTVPGKASVTHTDLLISPDYQVVEGTMPSGWTEMSVVCTSFDPITGVDVTRTIYLNDSGQNVATDNSFPIAPGVEAVCDVTNAGDPRVDVYKTTLGGFGGPFTLNLSDASGGAGWSSSTEQANTPTLFGGMIVAPGPVTFGESGTMPSGWSLDSLSCDVTDLTGATTTVTPVADSTVVAMDLKPGDSAACTAANLAPGTVSVTKTVLGTSTDWSFDFTILPVPEGETGTRTATAAQPTVSWGNLVDGAEYTIAEVENETDGFIHGTVDCGDGTGTAVSVGGAGVSCSVTNTELASLTVTKTVLPATATGWSFDFTITGPLPAGETATKTATSGAPSVSWSGLLPGTAYTVTEADNTADGYVHGTVDCGGGSATVTPTPGQAVACTITNLQKASVSATKTVVGTDLDWSFDFTITGQLPAGETATKTASKANPTVSWSGLLPGTAYTVAETAAPGYTPGAVTCLAGSATFTPQPGQSVACGVTNTAVPASVSVTKTVTGTGLDWSFDFTITGPLPAGETATKTATKASPTVTWNGLTPGAQYTVTETPVAGYESGVIGCGEGGSTFTPGLAEAVSCTVTNTAVPASVSVTKTVAGTAADWSFDFTISPVPAGEPATKTATKASPTVTWNGLVPGATYTVTEASVAGFVSGTIACGGGGATFTPGLADVVACSVTNTELARVSVTKTVAPAGETGWSYDFTINPVPAGEAATKTATAAAPTVNWTGLVPGTAYTVTEASDTDLVVGTMVCTGGTDAIGSSTFTPTAGQDVTCQITNSRIADVSVTKTASPSSVLPGATVTWTIVVANNGPSTALDVKLVDALPASLTLVSFTAPASWNCSATVTGRPGTLSCTKPDMLPGETWTFSVASTVDPAAVGGISIPNTAVVTTTTQEVTTTNNQDSAAINVEQVVVLPPTGGQARTMVELAAGLMLAGAALLAMRRRTTIG